MIKKYNVKRKTDALSFRRQIVVILENNGGMTIPELSKKMKRDAPSLYSAMNILIEGGFVAARISHDGEGGRQIRTFMPTSRKESPESTQKVISKARKLPQPFASMVAQMTA